VIRVHEAQPGCSPADFEDQKIPFKTSGRSKWIWTGYSRIVLIGHGRNSSVRWNHVSGGITCLL
jgi:hypothetical protein